jgi:hypothetical protein
MGKKAGWAVFALLALCWAGCVTKSTTTEGDREVLHQTAGAVHVVQESLSRASAAIEEGNPQEAKSLLQIGARAGADIQANMEQQLEVHGPPENPLPYSQEASAKARERSTKEHASSGWVTTALVAGGVVCSVAATLAGMPWLANLFPALTGKIGTWAKTGSQIITAARALGERNGGTIQVKDLLAIAKERNVAAGIQDIVVRNVDALEEKLGVDFQVKLDPPAPAPVAPAPATP